MPIKFGCCIPGASFMPEAPDKDDFSPYDVLLWGSKVIVENGFDFAECSLGLLMSISDEDFEKIIEKKIKIKIFNCFIPSAFKIIEDTPEMWEYIKKAFYRMNRVSAEIIVFGSGAARRIPDTMNYDDGIVKLESFISRCNDIAKEHNIMLALEPLNHNESNFLPTVKEAYNLAKKLNLSNVKILADIFHMYVENEDFSVIGETVTEICHTHINNPLTRACPTLDENEYIRKFAEALLSAGYSNAVTIESSFDDFENEIKDALKYLRKVFEQ